MNINNFIKFAEEASKNTKDNTQPPKYNYQPPKSNNRFDKPSMWQRRVTEGPVNISKRPITGTPLYMRDPYLNEEDDSIDIRSLEKLIPPRIFPQDERLEQFKRNVENSEDFRFDPNRTLDKNYYKNFLDAADYVTSSPDNARKFRNTKDNLRAINDDPAMVKDALRGRILGNPIKQVKADMARKTEKYGPIWPLLHANGALTGRYTEDSGLNEALNKLRELSKKYY